MAGPSGAYLSLANADCSQPHFILFFQISSLPRVIHCWSCPIPRPLGPSRGSPPGGRSDSDLPSASPTRLANQKRIGDRGSLSARNNCSKISQLTSERAPGTGDVESLKTTNPLQSGTAALPRAGFGWPFWTWLGPLNGHSVGPDGTSGGSPSRRPLSWPRLRGRLGSATMPSRAAPGRCVS